MADEASAGRVHQEPNRLHRRAERLERLVACLLGLLTAAAVGVALAAGLSTYASLADRARVEAADRTEVTAVLQADAAPVTTGDRPVAQKVPARWTDRHALDRTATVPVPGVHRAGDPVRVWTTDDGRVVSAPTTLVDATVAGMVVGVLVAVLGGGVVHLTGRGLDAWTARRFGRAWELEWERVGPGWTGGRRPEPPD